MYITHPASVYLVFIAQLLTLLIDKGAEIECRNIFGFTPLLEAVVHNRILAVRLLIQHGADVRLNHTPQAWGVDLSMEVKDLLDVRNLAS